MPKPYLTRTGEWRSLPKAYRKVKEFDGKTSSILAFD